MTDNNCSSSANELENTLPQPQITFYSIEKEMKNAQKSIGLLQLMWNTESGMSLSINYSFVVSSKYILTSVVNLYHQSTIAHQAKFIDYDEHRHHQKCYNLNISKIIFLREDYSQDSLRNEDLCLIPFFSQIQHIEDFVGCKNIDPQKTFSINKQIRISKSLELIEILNQRQIRGLICSEQKKQNLNGNPIFAYDEDKINLIGLKNNQSIVFFDAATVKGMRNAMDLDFNQQSLSKSILIPPPPQQAQESNEFDEKYNQTIELYPYLQCQLRWYAPQELARQQQV